MLKSQIERVINTNPRTTPPIKIETEKKEEEVKVAEEGIKLKKFKKKTTTS